MIQIRNYKISDYEAISHLYKDSSLYGGQFDENRDAKDRLESRTRQDPEAILVAEVNGEIVGTISLIEDGRVAWLFRFAVIAGDKAGEITKALSEHAIHILKTRDHNQVLVYAPANAPQFEERYQKQLGFEKGGDYTCYWKDI